VQLPGSDVAATHVEWGSDVYAPDYVPRVGELVFVDLTPELAQAAAERLVEKHWERGPAPLGESPLYSRMGQEETVSYFRERFLEAGDGAPALVVVDADLRAAFQATAAERAAQAASSGPPAETWHHWRPDERERGAEGGGSACGECGLAPLMGDHGPLEARVAAVAGASSYIAPTKRPAFVRELTELLSGRPAGIDELFGSTAEEPGS